MTFTATVAGTGGPATGTVTFKDGAAVLGTGTLASGVATCATSTLAVGSHSITAAYGGRRRLAASTSAAFGYSVSGKPVTITGVTAGNRIYDGTTAAALSGGTLTGVINGETVTMVAGTGTFASANAGTWAVTATGYGLGGANGGELFVGGPTGRARCHHHRRDGRHVHDQIPGHLGHRHRRGDSQHRHTHRRQSRWCHDAGSDDHSCQWIDLWWLHGALDPT